MSTDEGSAPHLILKGSRSGRLYASAIPAKGAIDYNVRFFANVIHANGLRQFINHSDNEASMLALKEAAGKANPAAEAVPRSCLVGDHQANGSIEVGVREVKRQMRATRWALEREWRKKLSEHDPVLCWMAGFAADTIAVHRRGKDGNMPHEREAGRKGGETEYTIRREAVDQGGQRESWQLADRSAIGSPSQLGRATSAIMHGLERC